MTATGAAGPVATLEAASNRSWLDEQVVDRVLAAD